MSDELIQEIFDDGEIREEKVRFTARSDIQDRRYP